MEANHVYRDGNGQPTDEPSLRAAYAEELAAEIAAEAKPKPLLPTVLEKEDRLLAENLALRVDNLTLVKQNFISDANARIAQMDKHLLAAQEEVKKMQATLSEKYAVDFSRQQIESGTGRIIPIT